MATRSTTTINPQVTAPLLCHATSDHHKINPQDGLPPTLGHQSAATGPVTQANPNTHSRIQRSDQNKCARSYGADLWFSPLDLPIWRAVLQQADKASLIQHRFAQLLGLDQLRAGTWAGHHPVSLG